MHLMHYSSDTQVLFNNRVHRISAPGWQGNVKVNTNTKTHVVIFKFIISCL